MPLRNWRDEHALVDLIREFLGRTVMDGDGTLLPNGKPNLGSGGWWRKHVVRNFPADIIEEACGEGRMMVLTNRPFNNCREAWLKGYLAKLAGRENLRGLPPGPPPVK
jgi:hypothetical protein